MLKVKTKLKESPIHGIGIFADEFIPKGTLIFEEDNLTVKFYDEDFIKFSEEKQEFIKTFCYYRNKTYYCSLDNDRFTNHSNNPNVYETENATYALKDIQVGEEITTNYDNLYENYNPHPIN